MITVTIKTKRKKTRKAETMKINQHKQHLKRKIKRNTIIETFKLLVGNNGNMHNTYKRKQNVNLYH